MAPRELPCGRDLSNNNLTELPIELGELTTLRTL